MTPTRSTDSSPNSTPAVRAGPREARLRAEHAHHYPGIGAGRWECAATLADRVLAACLLRGKALTLRTRCLSDQHFEFRGGAPSRRVGEVGPRREDR